MNASLSIVLLALAALAAAQDPDKPLGNLCPSGSQPVGPFRILTAPGSGVECLCNMLYNCGFNRNEDIADTLQSQNLVPIMWYGAYYGALGCGGGAIVQLNGNLIGTSPPTGDCYCSQCTQGYMMKTGVYTQKNPLPNYKLGTKNTWHIQYTTTSYCAAFLDFMICGVDANKPPACPPSPITRTAYEVGATGSCSRKGKPIIGAGLVCSAPSDEVGQKVYYSIIGGTGLGLFAIDQTTGIISVNTDDTTAINYENVNTRQFTLLVQAQDDGPGEMTTNMTVIIDILNCNDSPVVSASNRTVDENVKSGTLVGAPIAATDEDGGNLTFTLSGPDATSFTIVRNTGQIKTFAALDYEIKNLYQVIVTATDPQGASGNAPVTIQVNDVNDPPTLIDQIRDCTDGAKPNDPIGSPVTATDEDPNQHITYSISDPTYTFRIDPDSGQIRLNASATLDSTKQNIYSVLVTATDDNDQKPPYTPGSTTVTVTITVSLSTSKPPQFVDTNPWTVPENSPVKTTLSPPVTFTDPSSTSIIYSMVTVGSPFSINSSTGVISVARAELDYESINDYTIVIMATNALSISNEGTVEIKLLDENDPPVIPDQVFQVAENSPKGTIVGNLQVTDQDAKDQGKLTFTIPSGNDNNAFGVSYTLVGSAWVANLVVNLNNLDRETEANYHLKIDVSDQSTTTEASIDINLLNSNDPPSCPAQWPVSIQENSAVGTPVGIPPPCTDPDHNDLGYRILSGNDLGLFQMDPDGQLKVAGAIDYEQVSSVSLVVQAMDAGSLTAQFTMTVTIVDLNEPPTYDVGTRGATRVIAALASAGTTATNPVPNAGDAILFTDPDRVNGLPQTLVYTITSGNDAGLFAISSTTGIITAATQMPSRSSETPLTITCRDNGNPSMTGTTTITVKVDGTNAPPTCSGQTTFTVEEDTPKGGHVGLLDCSDTEKTLIGYAFQPATDLFAIDPSSGQITVGNALLNFEADTYKGQGFEGSQFMLSVLATDEGPGGASALVNITIQATDINEPPILPNQNAYVEVGSRNGRVVGPGPLSYTDEDIGQSATFSIVSGAQGLFSLDPIDGQLKVANQSSGVPASPSQYLISVRVTDTGKPPLSSTGIVTIIVVISCTSPRDPNCPQEYADRKFDSNSGYDGYSGASSASSSSNHTGTIVVGVIFGILALVLLVILALTMKRNTNSKRY